MQFSPRAARGFSLIEVVIVSAVLLLFFGGLFVLVEYVFKLSTNARARLSALSLANERMEYIRSLTYDAVGTVAGIPAGNIPQNRTRTFNGYLFNERVLIQYVDDDADGLGAADSNSILADYKQVKVEYSWNVTGATTSITLISNIVPRSIETTVGGGTIRVNVLDATVSPVPSASVRLLNTSGTTTIDVTRQTDVTGTALFAGAPAGSNYEIFVSKAGYSSDQTHIATTSNPNPTTQPISVLEADVSTMSFQIDQLSNINLSLYSSLVENYISESFVSAASIASSSNLAPVTGELALADAGGGLYVTSGFAFTPSLTASTMERWEVVSLGRVLPPGTTLRTQLYTGTSTFALIPDTDLPGNSTGFTDRLIPLTTLDPVAYPALVIGFTLETTDSSVTPRLTDATVLFRESATLRSGATVSWRGTKSIGTDLGGLPIYKHQFSGVTNASGEATFTDREWDSYSATITGSTITRACPGHPVPLPPGTTLPVTLVATPVFTNSLRINVVDPSGVPIPGAALRLSRTGYLSQRTADSCGSVFFTSMATESDYVLEVTAGGFTTYNLSDLTISGPIASTVTLVPL